MGMETLASGLQHIGIPTDDMEKSVGYYQKIGFKSVLGTALATGERVTFLKLGDLIVELYESAEVSKQDGAINHFAINVKDIEKVYTELVSMGIPLDNEIQELPFWENGVKFFVVTGPNREKIEFNQYL